MKLILIISILSILTGCASTQYSNVGKASDDMWLAITFDNSGTKSTIYSKVKKEVFDNLSRSTICSGWLQLDNCYWSHEGQILPVIIAGKQWGYDATTIIRIEDISRIIPVSEYASSAIESLEKLNQLE